ncbi:MAG TPA: ABC transporter ATP-binding protein [Clostridiales bacterium]|nr:ABC transporter ATP-binding protein [Clostridiales bacterium]
MKELRAILRYTKPYKWYLVLSALSMILVTAMNMIAPWMVRSLIQTITDSVSSNSDFLAKVSRLAILAVIVYMVRTLAQFGTDYVSHYAAWNMISEIRHDLYDHMQKLSLRFYHDKQTGDLMSRVIDDTRNFEQLLAHAVPTVVVNGLMLIGVSIMLFSMNATLALYTLIPMPILAWMVLKFSKISRPLFREVQVLNGEVNSFLQDNFSGIKEIKAFTKEEYESKRAKKSIFKHNDAMLRALRFTNFFHPSIDFVSSIGNVIVIFIGGRLALAHQLALEDLVAFLLYLSSFYTPITALGRINEGLQHALASAERVLDVLSQDLEVKDAPNAITLEHAKGNIRFQDVNFYYVEGIPVLKDISFNVNAGETVALVGPTGVGKTTIANLIPRFYDPQSGDIFLDGINIKNITQASLRKQISIVSQDVFLFNGTIKENILYGKEDATDEEVINAAKLANAHEFILELANGYDTKVGERGVKLSGGQKQRISIARAILKDAPILILDEATSSVDTQTEMLIQEALNKLKKNRTTIVIAHRISTIREADRIIVIKEGEIVEEGRHDELIRLGGLYSQLCKAQYSTETIAV